MKGFIEALEKLQKAVGIDKAKHLTGFEMSVWYIEGKVVSFLSTMKDGTLRVYDRREVDLSKSDGRLPKTFFDVEEKLLEYDYRCSDIIGTVTDDDSNEEFVEELLDLHGYRSINHNLIFSTDMNSVTESDYYAYRECFPADWEDCCAEKDYYFCITKDVGLRGKDENGKEFKYENGYWKIRAISFLDAHRFYEHIICSNFDYDKDYAWEIGLLNLDCDKVFRGVTADEYSDENAVKQFEEYKAKYLTGRKCFGNYSVKEMYAKMGIKKGSSGVMVGEKYHQPQCLC